MWQPINPQALPQTEVLGAEIDPETGKVKEIGFGYVYKEPQSPPYVYRGLNGVVYLTHYFDPKSLKVAIKQNNVSKKLT